MSANDSMAVVEQQDEWEQSKENFQPLKAGRKPAGLSDPLKAVQGVSIDEQKQKYIDSIKNYKGDDPIEVWLSYIKWTQETFKTGGHKSELLPLLEQCTRQLQSIQRYKTDIRYLRIWIQYADCLPDPSDVFSFLKENDIGQEHSLFYIAYSTFLELRGNYSTADNVYQQGINRLAQPLDRLKAKFTDFQHRMARRIQRKAQEQALMSSHDTDASMNHPERHSLAVLGGRRGGVGGGLASQKRKAVATPGRNNAPAGGGGGNSGLDIFIDEEFGGNSNSGGGGGMNGIGNNNNNNNSSSSLAAGGGWDSLPSFEQTRKENIQKASAWAGQRMKQQSLYTPSMAPTLDIPLDPEFDQEERIAGGGGGGHQTAAGVSLRQRLDRHDDEELAHDPLKWHKTQHHGNSTNTNHNNAIAIAAPSAMPRPSTLACDVSLLNIGDDDGHGHIVDEMSFEEQRALRWKKKTTMRNSNDSGSVVQKNTPFDQSVTTSNDNNDNNNATTNTTTNTTTNQQQPFLSRDITMTTRGAFEAANAMFARGLGEQPLSSTIDNIDSNVTMATKDAFAAINSMFHSSFGGGGQSSSLMVNEPTMTISTKAAFEALNAAFSMQNNNDDGSGNGDNSGGNNNSGSRLFVRQDTGLRCGDDNDTSNNNTSNDIGFDIREDTVFINNTAPQPSQHNNNDIGFDIREDTVFISRNNTIPHGIITTTTTTTTATTNDNDDDETAPVAHHNTTQSPGLIIREDTMFINPSTILQQQQQQHNNNINTTTMNSRSVLGDKKIMNDDTNDGDGTTRIIQYHQHHDENTHPHTTNTTSKAVEISSSSSSSGLTANFRDMHLGHISSSSDGSTSQDENAVPEYGILVPDNNENNPLAAVTPMDSSDENNDNAINTTNTMMTMAQCLHTARDIHDPSVAASVLQPIIIDTVPCEPHPNAEAALMMINDDNGGGVIGVIGDDFEVYQDNDDDGGDNNIMYDMNDNNNDDDELLLINPFGASFQHHMLSMLDPPVAEWPGVVSMNSDDENVAVKALKRVSSNTSNTMASFSINNGSIDVTVDGCLGAGAYATVYHAQLNTTNTVALKVESPPCPWEWYMCKVITGRIHDSPSPLPPHSTQFFINPSMLILGPTTSMLSMPCGAHGSLQDLLNLYLPKGQRPDEVIVARLAVVLFKLMETLHGTARVLHNDIKPDNILVLLNRNRVDDDDDDSGGDENALPVSIGLQLIDFGRSIDVELLPRGAMLTGDGGTDAFRCVEMREGKPYLWQADTYATAGVLHCLLFGEYMDVERVIETATGRSSLRIKSQFRRYWNTEMWSDVFDMLLNYTMDGIESMPPWGMLMNRVEEWLREPAVVKKEKMEMSKLLSMLH